MVFRRSYSYEDVSDDVDPYVDMISQRTSHMVAAAMDDGDAAYRKSRSQDDRLLREVNSRLQAESIPRTTSLSQTVSKSVKSNGPAIYPASTSLKAVVSSRRPVLTSSIDDSAVSYGSESPRAGASLLRFWDTMDEADSASLRGERRGAEGGEVVGYHRVRKTVDDTVLPYVPYFHNYYGRKYRKSLLAPHLESTAGTTSSKSSQKLLLKSGDIDPNIRNLRRSKPVRTPSSAREDAISKRTIKTSYGVKAPRRQGYYYPEVCDYTGTHGHDLLRIEKKLLARYEPDFPPQSAYLKMRESLRGVVDGLDRHRMMVDRYLIVDPDAEDADVASGILKKFEEMSDRNPSLKGESSWRSSSSTMRASSVPPKPMSDTRRKIRDTIKKSRRDPRYFD